jgi:hypothetical protein
MGHGSMQTSGACGIIGKVVASGLCKLQEIVLGVVALLVFELTYPSRRMPCPCAPIHTPSESDTRDPRKVQILVALIVAQQIAGFY